MKLVELKTDEKIKLTEVRERHRKLKSQLEQAKKELGLTVSELAKTYANGADSAIKLFDDSTTHIGVKVRGEEGPDSE